MRIGPLPIADAIETLNRRLGTLDPRQIAAWRAMSPACRLQFTFQAYQFALDTVRLPDSRPGEVQPRYVIHRKGYFTASFPKIDNDAFDPYYQKLRLNLT